jgi:hypothetical protein
MVQRRLERRECDWLMEMETRRREGSNVGESRANRGRSARGVASKKLGHAPNNAEEFYSLID